ncbi:MAG: aminotransferase class I/II-fold pyridoxal phosphate-dependent enzyme, partial [Defluviitaleaceae bacterium]|nr:aminotransferase class I/II-fold pyridoxal phosphate-dependent enzyme [Defluviitaleaceae bacterium]
MPGHKSNAEFFRDIDFVKMDITEVRGADNLRQPEGIIRQTEDLLASAYGANRSFMLVNGSSGGVLAALLYAVSDGDKIIVARNSHVSVSSGLALSGAEPVYVYPSVTPYGFAGGINPADVEAALAANKGAKAVFITSPTYEGLCSNVQAIAKIAHDYGALLIVDEAHGSHFGCHPKLPQSAVKHADIVVQSLHKNMVAPNQAAVLHAGKSIDSERLKDCLNMVQTTSPSYVTMAMIERCANIASNPAYFDDYIKMLEEYRAKIAELENIRLMGRDICGQYGVHNMDTTKIVLIAKRGSGADIDNYLLERHSVELELHGLTHAVALSSLADTKEGFERLYRGLCEMDNELTMYDENGYIGGRTQFAPTDMLPYKRVSPEMLPRAAQLRPAQVCELDAAIGKICASPVVPYPPGIPLLLPGEKLDENIIDHLKRLAQKDIMIIGISDGKIKVVACT